MLAEMSNKDESLRIDEKSSAPTVADLRKVIHPSWECTVDYHINSIARDLSVGVPNFEYLSTIAI